MFLQLPPLCSDQRKAHFVQRYGLTSQACASFARSRLKAQKYAVCANGSAYHQLVCKGSCASGLRLSQQRPILQLLLGSCFYTAQCQLSSVCSQQQHRKFQLRWPCEYGWLLMRGGHSPHLPSCGHTYLAPASAPHEICCFAVMKPSTGACCPGLEGPPKAQ